MACKIYKDEIELYYGRNNIIRKKIHQNIRINQKKAEAHGADQRTMPVVLTEFLKLSAHYPIVVTKNVETGKFVCVAVLGLEQGENLFWINNTWDAIYTPLNVQRQPFFVGNDRDSNGVDSELESKDRFVICLNSKSDSLVEQDGTLLFHNDGSETDYFKRIRNILLELLEGEKKIQIFLDKLVEMKLLISISLDVTFVNNKSQRIDGIYTIDENRLTNLTNEELIDLYSLGYLSSIYIMLTSLVQLYTLIERKNKALKKGADWFKKKQT